MGLSRERVRQLQKQFQSAPPTEVRGDMSAQRKSENSKSVSIRSPHRSEGRCAEEQRARFHCALFQSAPPTEVRGDKNWQLRSEIRNTVSIRSPHRSEGRYERATQVGELKKCFNPLPPPK